MRRFWQVLLVFLGLIVCSGGLNADSTARAPGWERGASPTAVPDSSVSHRAFDALLRRFVDEGGRVDYARLRANKASALTPYLHQLADADPAALNRSARLAFWINAYNAYTLKLIVDHYPVPSIWAVTPGPPEPKAHSPFDVEVGPVADTVRTLNEIEHEIIRERFEEPRIHFALVCAATSCPPLRREAYTGARLDQQLDDQGHAFLHNRAKNRIPGQEGRIGLSRLLKWYGDDFGASPAALQRALAPYFDGSVRQNLATAAYEVTYEPYDWTLNDQPARSENRQP